MADASGSNDSISSLCAMLASMGATQVTPDEIDASRAAIKANLLNGYSADDSPAKVLSANGASAACIGASVVSNADTKLENKSLLNMSGQLTVEELAAERKARKEAKKAKKIPGGATEDASQKDRKLSVKESDKENVPLADGQSSDSQEKSKVNLKKERRAIQEAQRAAKEKAMKTKTEAQIHSKQALPAPPPPAPAATTKAPIRVTHRFAGLQNKPRVKGASNMPFVGLLRDPEYVIEKPTYAAQAHAHFQKLADEVYQNQNTANDTQSVSFLTCLYEFVEDYWCEEEDADVERDINERLSPNTRYLEHYGVYTPPMRNIMSFFREMLRRANIAFEERLIELTDAKPKDGDEDEEGDEEEPATPWSAALDELKTCLQDWTISFFHKTYVKNEANMFPKVLSFLEDGDTLLLYGYSRLVLKAVQHACYVGGLQLSVVVMDNLAEGEDSGDMVAALQNTDLNGGFVLRAIIADLASLVAVAQKVLLPVNHVFSDGNTQAAAGHSLIVDAATKAEVPVLVFSYSYQYTDIAEQRPLQYNRLCPPEDYLWGRRPLTRVCRYIPRQGKFPATVALKARAAPGTYARQVTKDPLLAFKKSITDVLVRGPTTDSQDPDAKREDHPNVYVRGSTLSVSPRGMESDHPQYPVDVPACCLMFDVARSTVDYAVNDFCTMRPRCALTIMSRFHKLM